MDYFSREGFRPHTQTKNSALYKLPVLTASATYNKLVWLLNHFNLLYAEVRGLCVLRQLEVFTWAGRMDKVGMAAHWFATCYICMQNYTNFAVHNGMPNRGYPEHKISVHVRGGCLYGTTR